MAASKATTSAAAPDRSRQSVWGVGERRRRASSPRAWRRSVRQQRWWRGREGQMGDPEGGDPNTGEALETALTALDTALAAMEGLMHEPVPSADRPALLATVPAALAAVAALVEDAPGGKEPRVRE